MTHRAQTAIRTPRLARAHNGAMSIGIRTSFLPHTDPDASLAFWRDVIDFDVRLDVGQGAMRWITVGPKDDESVSIVLAPPVVDPAATDEERAAVASLMAKGVFAMVLLSTNDVDAEFARIEAAGADVIQEPTDQDWGPRDCALRDPAGNIVRLQQVG